MVKGLSCLVGSLAGRSLAAAAPKLVTRPLCLIATQSLRCVSCWSMCSLGGFDLLPQHQYTLCHTLRASQQPSWTQNIASNQENNCITTLDRSPRPPLSKTAPFVPPLSTVYVAAAARSAAAPCASAPEAACISAAMAVCRGAAALREAATERLCKGCNRCPYQGRSRRGGHRALQAGGVSLLYRCCRHRHRCFCLRRCPNSSGSHGLPPLKKSPCLTQISSIQMNENKTPTA